MRVAQLRRDRRPARRTCATRRAAQTAAPRRFRAAAGRIRWPAAPPRRPIARHRARSAPSSSALTISSSRPGASAALRCRRRSRLASCGTGEAGPDSTSCASAMSAAIFSARIIAWRALGKLGLLARLRVELRQFGRPRRADSRPRAPPPRTLARWRASSWSAPRQRCQAVGDAVGQRRHGRRRRRAGRGAPPASTSARSSCWPWISTSARPMSRISDTLAGWSLTKTRVRPSAVCTRRRMMSPSSSMALSARSARAGWLRGTSKTAVTWPLLRAVAHQRGVAARAERQRQRVEQDGFAGAGLAGQHGKAGREVDVQPLDQDDIADRQMRQHAGKAS